VPLLSSALASACTGDIALAKAEILTARGTPGGGKLSRSGINGTIALSLLLGTMVLNRCPDWFDRPIAMAINHLSIDWRFASMLAAGLSYPSVEGMITLSLVWYCWFSVATPESRARFVSAVIAAVLAGVIAHLLQHALPPAPKPIFDPLLRLHLPAVLGNLDTPTANSFASSPTFPSERATMFAGLAIAIFLIQRRLGLFALMCTMLVESSRIFLGLHYPTDIMGSYFLAGTIVCVGQMRAGAPVGFQLVKWERASPATFYMCASFVSYEMTSAFQDFRELGAQIVRFL